MANQLNNRLEALIVDQEDAQLSQQNAAAGSNPNDEFDDVPQPASVLS